MSMQTMGENMPATEKAVSHMDKYRRIKLEIEGRHRQTVQSADGSA